MGIWAVMLWLLPGDGQMLTGAMLIHDFVQVDRAYEEVRARVLARTSS